MIILSWVSGFVVGMVVGMFIVHQEVKRQRTLKNMASKGWGEALKLNLDLLIKLYEKPTIPIEKTALFRSENKEGKKSAKVQGSSTRSIR